MGGGWTFIVGDGVDFGVSRGQPQMQLQSLLGEADMIIEKERKTVNIEIVIIVPNVPMLIYYN